MNLKRSSRNYKFDNFINLTCSTSFTKSVGGPLRFAAHMGLKCAAAGAVYSSHRFDMVWEGLLKMWRPKVKCVPSAAQTQLTQRLKILTKGGKMREVKGEGTGRLV